MYAVPKFVYDPKSNVLRMHEYLNTHTRHKRSRSPANDPNRIPANLAPKDMVPLGKYALSIIWSDGHQSLMPYRAFVEGYR